MSSRQSRGGGRQTRTFEGFPRHTSQRGRPSYQHASQSSTNQSRQAQPEYTQRHPTQQSQSEYADVNAMKRFFEARTKDLYREINKQSNTRKPFYRGLIVLSSSRGSKDVQATRDLSQMLGVSEKPTLLERLSQQ
eukprot:gb/GECG01015972.1/.p1 GENE.gb/GECG01015972.1/~~gb/GECG01015972.1/.p1  ORF type:complete len:135 (+),score=14.89 gb/GECG01015972.1/:1-405(+)